MPSVMTWSKMLEYRKVYNLKYLEIMRNSGYDITFKLQYDNSRHSNWCWFMDAYVNGRRTNWCIVYGYKHKDKPPHRALKSTLHRLINIQLSMNLRDTDKEDNSNEKNQQRTSNPRNDGVQLLEERRNASGKCSGFWEQVHSKLFR